MAERYDYVAVNGDGGVYALCEDCETSESWRFIVEAMERGHRVLRLAGNEAASRHADYLAGRTAAIDQGGRQDGGAI